MLQKESTMGLASDNQKLPLVQRRNTIQGTDYLTNVSKIGILKEKLFCIPFFNRERPEQQVALI